jgi:hypothetical protein
MYLQKVISRIFFKVIFLLAYWRSMTKIAGSGSEYGSGSTPKCHGSATLLSTCKILSPSTLPPLLSQFGQDYKPVLFPTSVLVGFVSFVALFCFCRSLDLPVNCAISISSPCGNISPVPWDLCPVWDQSPEQLVSLCWRLNPRHKDNSTNRWHRYTCSLKPKYPAIRICGREYRLIRSEIINWRPGNFFKILIIQSHAGEEHKTIYSGLRINGMALSNQSDFACFFLFPTFQAQVFYWVIVICTTIYLQYVHLHLSFFRVSWCYSCE